MILLPQDFEQERYGLSMRLVDKSDAEFIIKLRTDPVLSKYLHPISSSKAEQVKWIEDYKLKEQMGSEYYFVFSVKGFRIGLERIYNIEDDTFTHGSLVFDYSAPLGSSILADISTREIGFDLLDKQYNLFDVRKGNTSVIDYHKMFKPKLIREDLDSYFYVLDKLDFSVNKNKYLKIVKY